jgi:group I intron endonuclease
MIGIYKITSPSGRIYIGQSIDIERRWSTYYNKDCKAQIKLNRSFEKYGKDKHTFEIIEECEIEQLNTRERYWQEIYDCLENGLNCLLTQTDEKPKVLSAETRQKISSSRLGQKASEETLLKMSSTRLGKKHSEETKSKMSSARMGKKPSKESCLKMSISSTGKKHSAESRIKMSEGRKKKIIDTVTKKIYNSLQEAAEDINMKRSTFNNMIRGYTRNKTTCCYLEEGSLYNQ